MPNRRSNWTRCSRSHLLAKKYSSARILQDLKAHGVETGLARQTAAAAREGDLGRAAEIWRRKFRVPPATREERARQMRFLQGRGFSMDTILRLLRDSDD